MKLKTKNRKKFSEFTNKCKLRNTTKQPMGQGRNYRAIKKYFKMNKISTHHTKLWEATKAILRRKVISVNPYIKKEERCQVNKVIFHIKTQKKSKLNLNQAEERK